MFITVIAKCRRNYFKMFVFVVLFVPGYVTLSMSNVFCCHLAYKVPLENLNYVGQMLVRHNNNFFSLGVINASNYQQSFSEPVDCLFRG
jgi:hypothetical protein